MSIAARTVVSLAQRADNVPTLLRIRRELDKIDREFGRSFLYQQGWQAALIAATDKVDYLLNESGVNERAVAEIFSAWDDIDAAKEETDDE